jgi:hypothetical protein
MAINRSQFVTATGAAVSSLSMVFANAVSSGNSIVVVAGSFSGAGSVDLSTVNDNVITAGFTQRVFSTMSDVADTSARLRFYDKLNISSGRGASTYRVNSSVTGNMNLSFCAIEYSGGPFTFGSTVSANGTSTGPLAGNLTASSTPFVIISGAIVNSTAQFASTALGGATYITTIDVANAAQITNIVDSTDNSSFVKNIGHSMTASTRWLAGSVVYVGLGSGGGGAAILSPWAMCMMGVQ